MGIIVVLLSCVMSAPAQIDSSRSKGTIRFSFDAQSASLFVDGVRSLADSAGCVRVQAGRHTVEVVHADLDRWQATRRIDTLVVPDGGIVVVEPVHIREVVIRTDPWGADVVVAGELIGRTPLRIDASKLVGAEIRMRGYDPVGIVSPEATRDAIVLRRTDPAIQGPPEVIVDPQRSGLRNESWAFVSAGAMIATGTLSVLFKTKANDAYASYLRTRSGSDLDAVRRNDRLAGVAIFGTQISLAAFVALLYTR